MRKLFAFTLALVTTGVLLRAQGGRSPEVLFKAAQNMEDVQGDLNGAIEQYRQVVDSGSRPLAAQALVRLAGCYDKLGRPESRAVYERILREYGDQREAAAVARVRLDGLGRAAERSSITLRRVWDGEAREHAAAVLYSADGRGVAYTPFGTGSVNLHNLATGADRALTASDQCSGPSAMSRDGTLVVYERYCGRYGSDLQLVNVRGTGIPPSRLLYENADVSQITPLDLSPDKTRIAVTLVRKDRTRQIGVVTTTDGSLRVLKSVDWRGASRLFFSPNGRDLAYDLPPSDGSEQHDVFVLAVDGRREIPTVVHPANDVVMGWTPDGRHILFASDRRSGAMGLWSQALDDRSVLGSPELIMENINSAASLGVTNSGTLYLARFAGDRDISLMPLDLAAGKQTAPSSRPIQNFIGSNLEPAWSPDGKSLAYVSWRMNEPGRPRVLAIRSMDTGDTRELRPNIAYFDQVSWSPDGRAFVTGGTDLKGRNWVFRIDARTGEVTTIAPLPQGFERICPQWSSDGKRLYYRRPLNEDGIDGKVVLIARELASGSERELASGDLGAASVSPDGRWIATQQSDRSTHTQSILLIPTTGGETRELFRQTTPQSLAVVFSGLPWMPDSQGLLVRKRPAPNRMEMWMVPIAGAPPRKLDIDVNEWATGNFGLISLSPDGRQIAFLSGRQKSELWALQNFLPTLKSERK